MVWKASQFVGVGIAKFPYDNTYVVVVQYQPPGNINTPGKFRRNVPVPTFAKSGGTLHESNVVANAHVNRDNDMNRNAEDVFASSNVIETENKIASEYHEKHPDLNAITKEIQTATKSKPCLDPGRSQFGLDPDRSQSGLDPDRSQPGLDPNKCNN